MALVEVKRRWPYSFFITTVIKFLVNAEIQEGFSPELLPISENSHSGEGIGSDLWTDE